MKINVHAGHNPDGKIACGASGFLKESTEARKVKKYLIKYLKAAGHTVYDCTCDNGTSQVDVLNRIVQKCNAHTVDLDVSLHLNSGRNDKSGDGKTGGVEVLVYSNEGKISAVASNVCNEVSKLGYTNRGVKENKGLYVLNSTKAPAMLVECAFVDDKDDAKLWNAKKMARAIAVGILNTYAPETYFTKKKVSLFNSKGKKNGKIKTKGTMLVINQFKFANGMFLGKIKGTKSWVRISKLT
ncbi:MAG: N-acetylmuramoyl-L-alanine amidase [Eubacterium sp.]|nr:N-acetylmuramoyl-L-alanine amidase [Eubacterium sp.]